MGHREPTGSPHGHHGHTGTQQGQQGHRGTHRKPAQPPWLLVINRDRAWLPRSQQGLSTATVATVGSTATWDSHHSAALGLCGCEHACASVCGCAWLCVRVQVCMATCGHTRVLRVGSAMCCVQHSVSCVPCSHVLCSLCHVPHSMFHVPCPTLSGAGGPREAGGVPCLKLAAGEGGGGVALSQMCNHCQMWGGTRKGLGTLGGTGGHWGACPAPLLGGRWVWGVWGSLWGSAGNGAGGLWDSLWGRGPWGRLQDRAGGV